LLLVRGALERDGAQHAWCAQPVARPWRWDGSARARACVVISATMAIFYSIYIRINGKKNTIVLQHQNLLCPLFVRIEFTPSSPSFPRVRPWLAAGGPLIALLSTNIHTARLSGAKRGLSHGPIAPDPHRGGRSCARRNLPCVRACIDQDHLTACPELS
jgi:hypothetical protein